MTRVKVFKLFTHFSFYCTYSLILTHKIHYLRASVKLLHGKAVMLSFKISRGKK